MPSTGAAHGRTGGRLSGASRAKSALAKAPQVTVLGVVDTPPPNGGLTPANQVQMAAAASAVSAMATLLSLTPNSAKISASIASAAVAAAMAAGQAPAQAEPQAAPHAVPSSHALGKRPAGEAQPPAA